ARVLGLRERDDAGADVSNRDRGKLLHRALEVLLRTMEVWPGDSSEARRRARSLLDAARPSIEATVTPKDAAVLDIEWRRVLAVIDELVDVEVGEALDAARAGLVREQHLEWPLEFALDAGASAGALRLNGKADRVDLWRDGRRVVRLRVRDYK